MKALIVYDSVYGNTEKIALTIAQALKPSAEVKALRVSEADAGELAAFDLLIVGAPTQGGRATPAINDLLGKVQARTLKNTRVAAFDTRMKIFIARLFGYAAGRIMDTLKEKGGNPAAPPEGFLVKGREGPVADGELERATAWAKGLLEVKKS